VNEDSYRGAAAGWARGAIRVYAPVAELLIGRSPIALHGAGVLDVGAGTGVAEAPLRAAGVTRIVAADLSHDMLMWQRATRPPAVVGDVMTLPIRAAGFDAAIASFVLNHLTDPVSALVELARALRPGGAIFATVYANSSHSANRDRIDAIAGAHGWTPPEWYRHLKSEAAPLLGSCTPMRDAATAARLTDITVDEEPVEVNVTEPEALVDYRFGQAPFAEWLTSLTPHASASIRTAAAAAIADTMEPYRPRVIFLTACTVHEGATKAPRS
jgi:ubiquinone/menaquinone biosynthesis C-methylase UbiE